MRPLFPRRRAIPALLVFALALAVPTALDAHARLKASNPAAGAQLTTPPTSIRLTFSEEATPGFSAIALSGPAGAVALGPLTVDSASKLTLVAEVPTSLAAGTYTVSWRAAAADGHPTRGTFTFTVIAAAAPTAAARTAAPTAPPAVDTTHAAPASMPPLGAPALGVDVSSFGYAVVRAVSIAAELGLIGAALFVLLILRRVRALGVASDAFAEDAAAGARRLALIATVVLVAAAPARLIAQSLAVFGTAGGIFGGALTGTPWGRAWILQCLASLVALTVVAAARGIALAQWRTAGVSAVAIALAWSLSGHAAATPDYPRLAVVSDVVHVTAAGAWIGTLAMLVGAGIPAALRSAEGARGSNAAALVNAFSPLALFAAAVLVVTGSFAAWDHLGSFAALYRSAYGLALVAKLAAVAIVAGIGAVNWRKLRPRLGSEEAARGIRRSALWELTFAALVIIFTAGLVATPTPDKSAPATTPAATTR
jgi:copper transport protein